jgi:ferredoxin--NADP+ reductase
MNEIVNKTAVGTDIWRIDIRAPLIAAKAKAGQFVIVRTHETGERLPLTLADCDHDAGTISLIFLQRGKGTDALAELKQGDSLLDVIGPLGMPYAVERFGTVACIGGGIGIPAIYPVARALAQAGNRVIVILAARSADLLMLEQESAAVADEVMIVTDDGSKGMRGLATDALRAVAEKQGGKLDRVVAVGPIPMMKAVCALARELGVPTDVSLDPIMVDGTGMCGSCRVTVDGRMRLACVDGPFFDGHLVDFDELATRQKRFDPLEQRAHERWHAERERS